jgi:SAM-dependent methyltransferase
MPGDYSVLATIHDEIRLGEYARHITPRLIDFAQRNDWLGRQVVDLGCGSGESIRWLAQHGYIVTGVDNSPAMLNIAKQVVASQGLNVNWQQQDILELSGINHMDMALALDVMHELNSLRDLEQAFKNVNSILKPQKLFIFDVYTIEGLAERSRIKDFLAHDGNGLAIYAQNHYDYERQIHEREFTIYHQKGDLWSRETAIRTLRAYPIQAVTALVSRCEFEVAHVLNANLSPHRPDDSTERVIIIAQKR